MFFDNVEPITRTEAEAGLSSDLPGKICDALIRITYHDPDWRWVQDMCIKLTTHSDPQVSGLAVTCLGHLARIHGVLDTEKVMPILSKLRNNAKISGRVADALDDIKTYLHCELELE